MRTFQSILVFLFSGLALVACGGGGGSTATPPPAATLDSTDQGAQALAAIFVIASNTVGQSGRAVAALNNDNRCDQGGSVTGPTFTSGNSARIDFNNCDTRTTENTMVVDALLDGRLSAVCNDSISTCNDATLTFGNGAAGLLIDAQVSENGMTDQDIAATLVGPARLVRSENGGSDRNQLTMNFSLELNDRQTSRELSASTNNLLLDVTTDAANNNSISVDGDYSIDNSTNCQQGNLTVATSTPILVNSNGDTSAGEIAFTNSSGQTSTAVFNANGSVTITANGQMQTYTEQDLAGFCN